MQRGVWCLQSLSLYVHPGGSSLAAKNFAKNALIKFATEHNHIKINVVHTANQYSHPRVIGRYANGQKQVMPLKDKDEAMIEDAFQTLRRRNAGPLNQRKWPLARTSKPSYQGQWAADAWSQHPLTPSVPKHVPKAAQDAGAAAGSK